MYGKAIGIQFSNGQGVRGLAIAIPLLNFCLLLSSDCVLAHCTVALQCFRPSIMSLYDIGNIAQNGINLCVNNNEGQLSRGATAYKTPSES